MIYQAAPRGVDAVASRGDVLFCHRPGLVSACIKTGERLRFKQGSYWTHCGLMASDAALVEARFRGVKTTALSEYRNIPYILVKTSLSGQDLEQASAFAMTCVGQEYGYLNDLGIALRFITPGRGLWFGMNGTEICSGLVAQALCRGWYNFSVNPTSISPAELAKELGAPSKWSEA